MRKKTEMEKFTGINEEQAKSLLEETRAYAIAFSHKNAKKTEINGKLLAEISNSKHSQIEKLYMAYTLGYNLGRGQIVQPKLVS